MNIVIERLENGFVFRIQGYHGLACNSSPCISKDAYIAKDEAELNALLLEILPRVIRKLASME